MTSLQKQIEVQQLHDQEHQKEDGNLKDIPDTSCITCAGTRGIRENENFTPFWNWYSTITNAITYTLPTIQNYYNILDLINEDPTEEISAQTLHYTLQIIASCRYSRITDETIEELSYYIAREIKNTNVFEAVCLPYRELTNARNDKREADQSQTVAKLYFEYLKRVPVPENQKALNTPPRDITFQLYGEESSTPFTQNLKGKISIEPPFIQQSSSRPTSFISSTSSWIKSKVSGGKTTIEVLEEEANSDTPTENLTDEPDSPESSIFHLDTSQI